MTSCIEYWIHYRKYNSKHGWYAQRWYEDDDGNIYWKYIGDAPAELTEKKDAMQWFFDRSRLDENHSRRHSQPDRLRKRKKPLC